MADEPLICCNCGRAHKASCKGCSAHKIKKLQSWLDAKVVSASRTNITTARLKLSERRTAQASAPKAGHLTSTKKTATPGTMDVLEVLPADTKKKKKGTKAINNPF